jgi:hypothetical protein
LHLNFTEGGGPDPKFNAQLSSIIEKEKKCNMPLASIQSAMKQDKVTHLRFDVFIAVTIHSQIFWATFNQCIVIKATCSFEMLVPLVGLQCHNPEDRSVYD